MDKLLAVLFVLITGQIQAQVVSEWRGDNRTGIYNGENLLDEWLENGPELLWTVNGIGEGYSSASVTEDAIYLTGLIDTMEYVTALDLEGKNYGKQPEDRAGTLPLTLLDQRQPLLTEKISIHPVEKELPWSL